MIPERIFLKGFLSYDAEQELYFDGAPLWLLSGPNGSGKSSVFDGMTFSLFGGHRAGEDNHQELINKNCDGAEIEFDFLLEGQRYRIRRTLARKKSGASCTQQVFKHYVPNQNRGEWEAIPDSSKLGDFNRWIQTNLGMTYKSFVSSVLLMQGNAERLLGSQPRERHQILSEIIGLARYEELHALADDHRKDVDSRAKELQRQLDGSPDISDAEIEQANKRVEAAESELEKTRLIVEELQGIEGQVKKWKELATDLDAIAKKVNDSQKLIHKSGDISNSWERLVELRGVLAPLKRAVDQRKKRDEAERLITEFGGQKKSLEIQLEAQDQKLEQLANKRQNLDDQIAANEERLQAIQDTLQQLAEAIAPLAQLFQARKDLKESLDDAQIAATQQRKAQTEIKKHEAELLPLQDKHDQAVKDREKADKLVTRRETLWKVVDECVQRFESVSGEKKCRYCGQPLTPGHLKSEKARLKKELSEAATALEDAQKTQSRANGIEQRAANALERAEEVLENARKAEAEWHRRCDASQSESSRLSRACSTHYQVLPSSYRSRVSKRPPKDWVVTTYPTEEELRTLGQEQTSLNTEKTSLNGSLKTRKQSLQIAKKEETQEQQTREKIRKQIEAVTAQLIQQQTELKNSREALTTALADLPAPWKKTSETVTATDLLEWEQEKTALQNEGAEGLYTALQQARATLGEQEQRMQDLENRRNLIPDAARRPLEEVRHDLDEARDNEKQASEKVINARAAKDQLVHRREQRRKISQERSQLAREHSLYQILARYLHRDYLQRHLMRQAEHFIVALACQILDRLSNGQLELRQTGAGDEGAASEKALVLEAFNRASASQKPCRVEMLSGSERFRVAVSLALAIGQFASCNKRAIQAVIIDEGFGCLDPTNRQLMIQELLNLQGQVQRILLVSHQDEFADAFPNGYRFEIGNGSTTVKRFPM